MKYSKILEDLKNDNEVKLSRYLTCKVVSNKYHIYECGKLRKSIYRLQDLIEYLNLIQA